MRALRSMALLWWVAGVVTVAGLVCAIVAINTPVRATSFGWFAYQPLAAQEFFPIGGVLLTTTAIVGMVITVIGLLLLTFLLGWRLSRASGGRITLDRAADAAYFSVAPSIAAGESTENVIVPRSEGEIVLDFDADGRLLGVEVVGAKALLTAATIANASRARRA